MYDERIITGVRSPVPLLSRSQREGKIPLSAAQRRARRAPGASLDTALQVGGAETLTRSQKEGVPDVPGLSLTQERVLASSDAEPVKFEGFPTGYVPAGFQRRMYTEQVKNRQT